MGWWLLANLLGFVLGIGLSQFVNEITGEIVSFLTFGMVLGLGQWLVLRNLVQNSKSWILATVLGATLGLAITNVIQRALVGGSLYFMGGSLGLAALGLVLGVSQWWVLRQHLSKAGWWIIIYAASWFVGGSIAWAMGLRLFEYIKIIADYAVLGLIVGACTGILLVLLRNEPTPLNGNTAKLQKNVVIVSSILILILLAGVHEVAVSAPVDLAPPPGLSAISKCIDLPLENCPEDDNSCSDLVFFEPTTGPGYINYPINDETWDDQYRSYLRRDLRILIKYASARVACETAEWDYKQIAPVGLGDMSEVDGAIPGTSIGDLGHPMGTHQDGTDIDIAYFQMDLRGNRLLSARKFQDLEDNLLRSICKFTRYGMDVYRCTEPPQLLDPWRTALFITYVAENPYTRVIGVDGQVGPLLDDALDQLAQNGLISHESRERIPLVYETVNEGMGWFRFHHHHLHVSMNSR
jgi:hypothetical protein